MQLGNEASVQDILASIKRVIARDGSPPVAPVRAAIPAEAAPTPLAEVPEAPAPAAIADVDAGPAPTATDPMTSTITDDALRASFSQLTAVAGLAQDGGAPLDDVVQRTLRPLLAQWLDAHLPAMVERLVREEIARIAGPRG